MQGKNAHAFNFLARARADLAYNTTRIALVLTQKAGQAAAWSLRTDSLF